jgi:hypothetical protein
VSSFLAALFSFLGTHLLVVCPRVRQGMNSLSHSESRLKPTGDFRFWILDFRFYIGDFRLGIIDLKLEIGGLKLGIKPFI